MKREYTIVVPTGTDPQLLEILQSPTGFDHGAVVQCPGCPAHLADLIRAGRRRLVLVRYESDPYFDQLLEAKRSRATGLVADQFRQMIGALAGVADVNGKVPQQLRGHAEWLELNSDVPLHCWQCAKGRMLRGSDVALVRRGSPGSDTHQLHATKLTTG